MQSHNKNNKCNHICFVTHSYSHTIPMNIWQRGQQEEQETPFNVAADDSYRTNAVKIFLYHFIDIYCSSECKKIMHIFHFQIFQSFFFCDMC